MTQTQETSPVNDAALLRSLLRDIADDADLAAFVPKLLPQLRTITGADAAFCIAYAANEQYVDQLETGDLPDLMWLRDTVQQHLAQPELTLDLPQSLQQKYSSWNLLPIRINEELDALVGLVFEEVVGLNDDQLQALKALLDGLTIVLRIARARPGTDP